MKKESNPNTHTREQIVSLYVKLKKKSGEYSNKKKKVTQTHSPENKQLAYT